MHEHRDIERFWGGYLQSVSTSRVDHYYEAFRFGNTERLANELAALVVRGEKTATSGLLWCYEQQGRALWRVGDLHVVCDWEWQPVCVIETVELRILPFRDVDAQFAFDYGEGDRTLTWWREHMWTYYVEECRSLGRAPSEDMPLVCERFHLVYPARS